MSNHLKKFRNCFLLLPVFRGINQLYLDFVSVFCWQSPVIIDFS